MYCDVLFMQTEFEPEIVTVGNGLMMIGMLVTGPAPQSALTPLTLTILGPGKAVLKVIVIVGSVVVWAPPFHAQ